MNVNDIIVALKLAVLADVPCILTTNQCKRLIDVLPFAPENLVETSAVKSPDDFKVTTTVYPIWNTDWTNWLH
jgi:hypothetical protein